MKCDILDMCTRHTARLYHEGHTGYKKRKNKGCFMKKLLLTEFEKMCLNCGSIELKSIRYDRVKVVLHPNRVCLLGDSGVYCIDGVKYILQHTNAPCCFDVVSRELDNDYDTIYKLVINSSPRI